MSRCPNCDWNYPDEMLNQVFANGGYTPPMCGICALDYMNRALGINRKSFSGEMAEEMRLDAIAWRKQHPQEHAR